MYQIALSLLLQLALASSAFAAPVSAMYENSWQAGTGAGIVGFIVLVLDIIVFLEVLKSDRPVSHKIAWCLLVFLFPVLGLIIYWLFSNRAAHNSRGSYEVIP